MNEQEQKAWEELVESINYGTEEIITPHQKAILTASSDLTALRSEAEQYKAAAEDDLVLKGELRQQLYDLVLSRELRYKGNVRPILYTDTVQGEQVCCDNLWAITTEELNALTALRTSLEKAEKVVEISKQILPHLERHAPTAYLDLLYSLREWEAVARALCAYLKEG
jgi:hypothetical protein